MSPSSASTTPRAKNVTGEFSPTQMTSLRSLRILPRMELMA